MTLAAQVASWYCIKCNEPSGSYLGQCPKCGTWSSMRLEVDRFRVAPSFTPLPEPLAPAPRSIPTTSVAIAPVPRVSSHATVDRVLGGGFVEGATYLVTGRPGIGKSTIGLQIGGAVASLGRNALVVATEETQEQIAERARRCEVAHDRLALLPTTDLEETLAEIDAFHPALVIVDSSKYLCSKEVSSPIGSPAQMLAVGNALKVKAKAEGFAVLFLGHIVKNGSAAGPKELEHLVDATLTFDISAASAAALEEDEPVGDEVVRVFRSWKNRFGALASARFQMTAKGLVEVAREDKEVGET